MRKIFWLPGNMLLMFLSVVAPSAMTHSLYVKTYLGIKGSDSNTFLILHYRLLPVALNNIARNKIYFYKQALEMMKKLANDTAIQHVNHTLAFHFDLFT